MKCHACAHDNADSALFCGACRRPLVAPSKPVTRLEPLPAGAGGYGGSRAAAAPLRGGPRDELAAGPRNPYAPPREEGSGRVGDDPDMMTEADAWGAIIGNTGTQYYLERFERQARGEGGGWHWPAMLVTWYWMLYRKMWLAALIYFFVPGMVGGIVGAMLPRAFGPLGGLAVWLALFIVPGMFANGWYFRHCEKKIRDVEARGGTKAQMIARMEAVGGTSILPVVLLGILLMVAIIGVLAAVALPAYQGYTAKAKVAEAVQVGSDVAAMVGRQYEQTGTLPGSADVVAFVGQAPHRSRYVTSVDIDPTTGVLTLKVQATPKLEGEILLQPSVDASRHLRWHCATTLPVRYSIPSCRAQAPSQAA